MDRSSKALLRRRVAAVAVGVVLPIGLCGAQSCASIAGNWQDNFAFTWILQQSSPTQISGTKTNSHHQCVINTWPTTGTRQGGGPTFQLVGTNPSGDDGICAATVTYTISVNAPGCNTGQGNWVNSRGASGAVASFKKNCSSPSGESSSSAGWADSQGFPTVHQFEGHLSGSENFGGRTVAESGSGGTDFCWFAGSAIAPFTGVTGGTWNVGENNLYGDDFVGYLPAAIAYYRALGRAPCTAHFPQTMTILCNGVSDIAYETHDMDVAITTTTLIVTRDGVTAQRTWP